MHHVLNVTWTITINYAYPILTLRRLHIHSECYIDLVGCALVSDGTSGSGQIPVIFSGSAFSKTCLQPESIFLNNSYFSCSLINRAKVRYDRAFVLQMSFFRGATFYMVFKKIFQYKIENQRHFWSGKSFYNHNSQSFEFSKSENRKILNVQNS